MVAMTTNTFCESIMQRMTCMVTLHPNPKFICLLQFNKLEHNMTSNCNNLYKIAMAL